MQRYKSLEWVGANALWQVQAPNGINTDPVAPGCGYSLQHLPSGKYLAVESSQGTAAAGGGAGGAAFPLKLLAGGLEQAALFELQPYAAPAATLRGPACNPMRPALQPYVAALQPYVRSGRALRAAQRPDGRRRQAASRLLRRAAAACRQRRLAAC